MKRPFMGTGIALAAGVAAGWFHLSGYVVWLSVILILGIGGAGCIKKYWTDRTYKYVIGLSVFFIVGFCRVIMGDKTDENALSSVVYGTIERVQEKNKVDYVYVRSEDGTSVLAIIKKEDRPVKSYYKGQQYEIRGTPECFESASNPGQFDALSYYRSQGVRYCLWADTIILCNEGDRFHRQLRWIEDLKRNIQKFYETHMGSQGNGVLQAAVIGERSALDADVKRYYQENGWMHLITASGLHLSFIAMNMYKRMRKMTIPVWVSTIIAFGLMLGYGYMTDYGDSMLRAMGMMMLTLIAKIVGRRTDGWTSLSMLGSGLLFLRPERILSAGFWLTFAAVGGMEWGKWLAKVMGYDEKRTWMYRFKTNLCVQTGIFVMTLPILLWTMYEISVFGFVYNFFMIPLISAIVPAAFAAGIGGCVQIPVFQTIGSAVIRVIDTILECVHMLPSKVWVLGCPKRWQILLFCLGVFCMIALVEKGRKRWGMCVLLMSCLLLMFVRIRTDEVIFADVGQGDGICLLTKDGRVFMVDGGSSTVSDVYTYRLEPLLKYYGMDAVDVWFVTHGDQDHISGLLEALEKEVPIGMILFPDVILDASLEKIRMKAEAQGIGVKTFYKGDCVEAEGMKVECLYPMMQCCTGNKNGDSMVLSVEMNRKGPGCRMLLTGDLDAQGESILLEGIEAMDVDVLKVGHHGSSGGTTEAFLEWMNPEWGIISCGVSNRYGHPHKETLSRLETSGCKWISTASYGAIFVRTASDGYQILGYEKQD